jgi:thiol-disulfide isomerase/thioredoxin
MAKRFFKFKFKNKLHILLLIILVIGILYIASKFSKKCLNIEGFEGKKELLLLHMDGCGHCEKLMPHWAAAEKDNDTDIKMRSVEQSKGDGPALCKKHKVSGFPTILLLDGGEKVDTYDGDRTKSGLMSYLNNL